MEELESFDLNLKKIILYKTGLGYFEKEGILDLKKQKRINLSFKTKNMNDLLKTFSIHKVSGNFNLSGISYESEQSNIQKLLEDSIIKLPENDTLDQLIIQLRGMKVRIKNFEQNIEGIVVGLQNKNFPIKHNPTSVLSERFLMLNVKDNNKEMLKSFKLKEINELQIMDGEALDDFNFFMDVIGLNKKEKNRTISIFFSGEESCKFKISFLQEVPAWKTSYRIFMADDEILEENDDTKEESQESSKTKQVQDRECKIILQGWAIIDNILDEDWNDVKLNLVSGIPISFKYDSYSPLYINRPTVQREQELSVKSSKGKPIIQPTQSLNIEKSKDEIIKEKDIVKKIVENNKLEGPNFQYNIPNPVKVKRNQSSLIPIVQKESSSRILYVYNENAHPKYPLSTMEFKNDTELELVQGPVSIFKNNIFEGEAMLPFLNRDEKHWIPFAIHQGIEIEKESKSIKENYNRIIIGRDIVQYYFQIRTYIYYIKNISGEIKDVIIEHPIDLQYELFESPEIEEKTENYYRFRIHLEEKESKKIVIKERKEISSYVYLQNLNLILIDHWLEKKLISEKKYNLLKKSIEFRNEINTIKEKMNQNIKEKQSYSGEHSRIRDNLKVLKDSKSDKRLRNRYIKKLEREEARIEEIERENKEYNNQISALNRKMRDFALKELNLKI